MNLCKICAGIVTYNPAIDRLESNIISILPQVDKLIVVDNFSNSIEKIEQTLSLFDNVHLIKNTSNEGIAKALNQMCQFAFDHKYDWIITLDQDTVCPSNIIEKMIPYADISNIGIVCPEVNYEGWSKKNIYKDRVEYVKACMTSASLTNLLAWNKVDGFEEDYFIDFVDNEFCMKLNLNGYKILRVFECVIDHQLGDSSEINVLGLFKIHYTKHSPLRFYYMSRNNYVFINKYHQILPVFKEYCKLAYIIIKGIIFSEKKIETMRYIGKGLKDGRKKKMGEINYTQTDCFN